MNILVLGASGLLGNAVLRVLSEAEKWSVTGTTRRHGVIKQFPDRHAAQFIVADNLEDYEQLEKVFNQVKPDIVINCISMAKEALKSADPLRVISVYSLLPQRISRLCEMFNARFIHMSSDGVFSGKRGDYTEQDLPDAEDIYGVSKILGEVMAPHAISLRTSIIGHELNTANGLLEWFLSQKEECKCFTRVIFSGLPTVVLAQIIRDVIIPDPALSGVYHIAAKPVSKFDLLALIAKKYKKSIRMLPDDTIKVNRSLNAAKFQRETGYSTPDWPELIDTMYSYHY